ncbi:MAG: LytTR family DNA-binding domain-containing protein [Defluviitaleaceae bacterium]|nr:LytTR family DNA-binding domain-containing protein [Defluviitaleaceae bacterium]
MLSIFVCEDQDDFLSRITECISNYIKHEQLDAVIACATPSPNEIVEFLKTANVYGLYFLDLHLNAKTDGFQLATEIRKYDPRAFIVIVTNDLESKHLSFKYVIEAMDYVTKDMDDFDYRLRDCVRVAYDRHLERFASRAKKLELKLAEDAILKNKTIIPKAEFVYLDYDDVVYIEASAEKPHHITVYAASGRYISRADLRKLLKSLDNRFVRCHKSYIVNTKKIQSLSIREARIGLMTGPRLPIGRAYIEDVRESMNVLREFL